MYLKSIKAQGFKSFADKIELDFSSGVTAIVGPNGSGKSNISDAVRWVLGEQSAKSLRGSNMQDVIFSGTQKRSALGFAEVSLTLDNTNHTFNTPFEELTVTRKVYRSGESEYLINNAPCRLRDIHEVFMDTGLGKDGYSMIGQGRIEEILSSKSEDRRQIFEEASGISKYRYRKEEAQRKLTATEDNLSRILDIIAELESQLGPLEKQSEKAREYLRLREQLRTCEVNVALHVIDANRAELEGIQEKFDIVSEQLETTRRAMEQAEAEQEGMYRLAAEKERFARETEGTLHDTEAAITRLAGEIEVLHNTIAGNKNLRQRVDSEVAQLTERIAALGEDIKAAEVQLTSHQERCAVIDNELAELTQQAGEFTTNAGEHNSAIESLKNAVVDKLDEISDAKIRLSNFDIMKRNYDARRTAIAEETAARQTGVDELTGRVAELEASLARKTAFVEEVRAKLEGVRQEETQLAAQNADRQREATHMNIQLNEKKSRYNILKAMEQNYEGYNRSVKSVMKEHAAGSLKKAVIHGPVSKLVDTPAKYVTAIETALGAAMQNIVVGSEYDAKAAIDFLKRTNGGRATFMPVSAMRGRAMDDSAVKQDDGYVGIASRLVRYDKQFEGVVGYMLGRTVVVDHVDNGIKMSKKHKNTFRIVTLDGEVFNVGGSMAGGSSNKHASLLGRESEIAALQKAIASLETSFAQLSDEVKAGEQRLAELRGTAQRDAEVVQENTEITIRLEHDIQYNRSLLADAGSQLETLAAEDAELVQKIAAQDDGAAAVQQQLADKEREAEQLRAEVNRLEQDFERVMVQRQRLQDKIVDKTVEKNAVLKDIEISTERIASLEAERTGCRDSIDLRRIEVQDIGAKNEQLRADIEQKTRQTEQNRQAVEQLKARVESLLAEKQHTEEQSRTMQAKAKELRETVYDLQQEHTRIEGKKVKYEMERDNAVNRLWDEYELTYTTAQEYRTEMDSVTETSKEAARLRASIRNLGNVNVDAIEEYKAVRERYQFLTTQRDDLVQAKQNLLALIDEMVEIMRGRFVEQFDVIDRHFRETFRELFGGGRAELRLADPSNVLESGIDIDVQPPGKKLQSLSLLSGGERALSAIALLFAIIKTRPTPFCFLDEIEAALDDVNVYRFADYVRHYSDDTQFIIVTHRRGTMEAADVIYGVTMQEKGISKLLRLDLDEAMASGK